ncbi:MAG: DUF4852 domain-containing protein [Alphaproteobacteria bacterium]|nr:DUF4852 domain-containing protein [Alphaproteobacteria bacterium]
MVFIGIIRKVLFFCVLAAAIPFPALAQDSGPASESLVTLPAAPVGGTGENRYTYEDISMEAFARLYWALSRLDIASDINIDNYMMITQCDIYKDYSSNEFEWKTVRASARSDIEKNRRTFPIRYQFMQPLRLGEYSIDTGRFEVMDKYKINGTRRFEVVASQDRDAICGKTGPIIGYPRGIMLELSRPFTLKSFPVDPGVAEEYVSKKLEAFRKLKSALQTEYYLYELRDAYIVMKIKAFSSQGQVRTSDGKWLAHILGVLEGYEIYADEDRKVLLYQENLVQRKRHSQLEREKLLKEQYERQKTNQVEEPANIPEPSQVPAEVEGKTP